MVLVIDYERSERGQQRRKDASGRQLHCCCICGKLGTWGSGWSTYCSEKDIDDSAPIPKFCSTPCREKGGKNAHNVTQIMKQIAKDSEWRDPEPVYREQTEREKYNDAADAQRRREQRRPPPTDNGSVT